MSGGGSREELSGACVICFHRYEEQEELLPITLPGCGHSFCKACSRKLRQTAACPTCRCPILLAVEHLAPSFEILALSSKVGALGGDVHVQQPRSIACSGL